MEKITANVVALAEERYAYETYLSDDEGVQTVDGLKQHLFLHVEDEGLLKISVETRVGSCYSGYTSASYGYLRVKEVEGVGPFTHRPIKPMKVSLLLGEGETLAQRVEDAFDQELYSQEDIPENDLYADFYQNLFTTGGDRLLTFTPDGGDSYYPIGEAKINTALFVEGPRSPGKRIVYVFKGASGLGKSSLAFALKGKSVYETDSSDMLPDEITADVIVIGNRGGFTLEEVRERVYGDAKIVLVSFDDIS